MRPAYARRVSPGGGAWVAGDRVGRDEAGGVVIRVVGPVFGSSDTRQVVAKRSFSSVGRVKGGSWPSGVVAAVVPVATGTV